MARIANAGGDQLIVSILTNTVIGALGRVDVLVGERIACLAMG